MRKLRFVHKKKSIPVSILTMLLLLYGIFSFYTDVTYFFQDSKPLNLGKALEVKEDALQDIKEGEFVQISGIRSIHVGSIKKGFLGEEFLIYYFMGSPKFIVIEPMPENKEEKNIIAHRVKVKGRIFSFEKNNDAQRMRQFFLNSMGITLAEDGFLIQSGHAPGEDYLSVIFFVLLIVLLGVNIYLLIRSPKEEEMEEDLEDI